MSIGNMVRKFNNFEHCKNPRSGTKGKIFLDSSKILNDKNPRASFQKKARKNKIGTRLPPRGQGGITRLLPFLAGVDFFCKVSI